MNKVNWLKLLTVICFVILVLIDIQEFNHKKGNTLKLIIKIIRAIGICLVFYYGVYTVGNSIEKFTGTKQELKNKCQNYNSMCINSDNTVKEECNNNYMIGCQKFHEKCKTTCQNKGIDDYGKKETDLNKCLQTCQEVLDSCCNRLIKYNS